MNHTTLNKAKTTIMCLAIVSLCIYISWMPVFHHHSWNGQDAPFHFNRILSTINGIKNGQVIPLYDVDYINHPGYGSNLFYPPLTNLLGSLVFYFVNDLNVTAKILAIIIAISSTTTAYIVLLRLNHNKGLSAIFSLCFSCSIYVIDNVFIRSAYPESISLCAIPLFLYGLICETRKGSIIFLITANVILILSNIPMTLCSGVVFLIYYAFHRERFVVYVYSVIIAFLLCAWYTIPLIYSTFSESFAMININWFSVMTHKSITIYELLSGEKIKNGPLTGMAIGIGAPTIIALGWTFFNDDKNNTKLYFMILAISFLICGGINYSLLPDILVHLSKIQLIWRCVPFLLFIILIIIHISQKLSVKNALLTLLATSLMTSAITVPKNSSSDLTVKYATNVNYKDYVLNNAEEIGDWKLGLTCVNGASSYLNEFSYSLNSNGLPVYTIKTPNTAICNIPFMAYKSLDLLGSKKITRNGYFKAEITPGNNILEVQISKQFKTILTSSVVISLSCLALIIFLFIKNRHICTNIDKFKQPILNCNHPCGNSDNKCDTHG